MTLNLPQSVTCRAAKINVFSINSMYCTRCVGLILHCCFPCSASPIGFHTNIVLILFMNIKRVWIFINSPDKPQPEFEWNQTARCHSEEKHCAALPSTEQHRVYCSAYLVHNGDIQPWPMNSQLLIKQRSYQIYLYFKVKAVVGLLSHVCYSCWIRWCNFLTGVSDKIRENNWQGKICRNFFQTTYRDCGITLTLRGAKSHW